MDERKYSYYDSAPNKEAGQLWRQHIIAGVANLAIATFGICLGWTSPVNMKLKDLTESPLPEIITIHEESWIGSIMPLGAIFGAVIGGPLASRVGRKWGLLASSIPLLVGWVLIAAATSVTFIYSGRVMWGVGAGILFTITPMYCAEIATNDSRGALCSYVQMSVSLGIFLVYSIGPYISYSAIAYCGTAFVAVFDIIFFFMPETPIYYLTKNDRESAAKSLMMLRGRSRAGVEVELDLMTLDVAASIGQTATIRDVFKGNNFKAFYISCALIFFQQFCGVNAVLFYMTNIFEAAGSTMDAVIATIIIGAVQMIASCVTPFVVDRLGRRVLLLFSSCGSGIALGSLGVYFLLDHIGSPAAASIGFLPLLSLVAFIVTCYVGLGPLPWIMMSELLPMEVKAVAAPIVTAFFFILIFLITRFFGPVSEAVGMYVAFWFFGVCCFVAFIFVILVVPETKGKSFAEIQELLSKKSSKEREQALT